MGGILHLNTRGRLAHEPRAVMAAVHAAAARAGYQPLLLMCTETWVRPGCTPPLLQGYVLIISVPSPLAGNGRGRGGVAIYAAASLVGRVRVWGEGRDGVAWVRVCGVLDRPLFLAACYIPPLQSAADLATFYRRLLHDVLAAQPAGYIVVGGDLNARTGGLSEAAAAAPPGPVLLPLPGLRASRDEIVNPQGRALLSFCQESGLWVGNGRLPGDVTGEWTYHSLAVAGGVSVVDYFLLDSELVGREGTSLFVHPPAELLDHAVVELRVGGMGEHGWAVAEGEAGPRQPSPAGEEFRVTDDSIPPFAGAAAKRAAEWAALAGMADRAHDLDQLTHASQEFDRLVGECAREAGMCAAEVAGRQPAWARRAGRSPVSASLRRQRRRALSRGDRTEAAMLNRQACAEARKHKRQRRAARQKQLLEWRQSDPARFASALRGKQQAASAAISGDEWVQHFESLLGGVAGLGEQQSRDSVEQGGRSMGSLDGQRAPAGCGQEGAGGGQGAAEGQTQLQEPFSEAELMERVKQLRRGKSVLGALKPTMLKGAIDHLAQPLLALLNACVTVGQLPRAWAVSALIPIRKPGADHSRPAGYRGIALGTLPAKLFGGMLADRFTHYTEALGLRAQGQAGFRPNFGCSDQIFTLRAVVERQRARRQRLYVCYVDFKQAFDRVPRHLLWGKLERVGITGWALRAVQALYVDVPMCVKSPTGYTRCLQASRGVKQE